MNGDPFHAACPTIETMGDPFALAGRNAEEKEQIRFSYKLVDRLTRRWDHPGAFNDNFTYYIVDERTGERTCNDFREHQVRDYVWKLNKHQHLKSDYDWCRLNPCR